VERRCRDRHLLSTNDRYEWKLITSFAYLATVGLGLAGTLGAVIASGSHGPFGAFVKAHLILVILALTVITVTVTVAERLVRAIVAVDGAKPLCSLDYAVGEFFGPNAVRFPAASDAGAVARLFRYRLCPGHPRYQGRQQATPEDAPERTQRPAARNRALGQSFSYPLEAVFRRELVADRLSVPHLFSFQTPLQ
jgi:hypothetical protein